MSESYQQSEPQFTRKMACELINATPALQSLLYDLNLLPEIALSNEDERRMMLIVVHWREAERIRDELREGMCSAADYAKGVEAERDDAKRSLSDVTRERDWHKQAAEYHPKEVAYLKGIIVGYVEQQAQALKDREYAENARKLLREAYQAVANEHLAALGTRVAKPHSLKARIDAFLEIGASSCAFPNCDCPGETPVCTDAPTVPAICQPEMRRVATIVYGEHEDRVERADESAISNVEPPICAPCNGTGDDLIGGGACGTCAGTGVDRTVHAIGQTEPVARWMIDHGYATGHGDTLDDLLQHLVREVKERDGHAIVQVSSEDAFAAWLKGFDPELHPLAVGPSTPPREVVRLHSAFMAGWQALWMTSQTCHSQSTVEAKS